MGQRGAMVTTWGTDRSGLPADKGMAVFTEALGWYDELSKEGRISGYRVFGNTTRAGGMIIAEGELSELARISAETKSMTLLAKASAVVEDVCSELLIGGNPDDVTKFYTDQIQALADAGLLT